MGLSEAVSACFSKFFQFSGRASRPEYWWFVLFTILGGLLLGGVGAVFMAAEMPTVGMIFLGLYLIFVLACSIPALAAAWRRMHDAGKSGWWLFASLIGYIPMLVAGGLGAALQNEMIAMIGVGLGALLMIGLTIYALVLLVSRSQDGENRFGPQPQ